MDSVHETQIRVLTLNCWGLKYVSRSRTERIKGIAAALAQADYDLIGLQEVWVEGDFELIRAEVGANLPYAKFFRSGALGAGLCMFSRYPITDANIQPYSLNGSPLDVIGGDWFVGKAVANVIIEHPILGEIDFLNTHFHARGGDAGSEVARVHRNVNAWQFARRAYAAAALGRHVIATGDFNSLPRSLALSIVRDYAGLTDAWDAFRDSSSLPSPSEVSAEDAVRIFGITADSPLNSYSAQKHLTPETRINHGKRLDYIFYREPITADSTSPSLRCSHSLVVFTGFIPGTNYSYSDHFGVEATLVIDTSKRLIQNRGKMDKKSMRLSEENVHVFRQTLIDSYHSSESRSHHQLIVFAALIAVLVLISAISLIIIAPPINFFLNMSTIIFAWLATTMLYVGFIFGRWEMGAILNVIEELDILRSDRDI